jgi:general secretion pathway protein D
MIYFKQLAAVFLAAVMILPPAPLAAGTRKGDKLRNQARTEEVKGNLEHALELTSQAVDQDPSDPAYLLQFHRIRFELGVVHIAKARKLRDAGKLSEALAEYQKAAAVDPASDIALQEIRRTEEMIDREKKLADQPGGRASAGGATGTDTSSLTPAAYAKKEAQDRTDALRPVAVLRPLNPDLIDLKMTNRPRTLFETVGADAGINVVFDPDYNSQQTITQPVQIDLKRTTIEAALDQISLQTKSFWKTLDSNTIFVAVDSRNNRTTFTEQVVKVFYLSNPTGPQEIQEILTVLRTVVDVQKVFNYSAQNALVVRCDADVMALVEKLISDLDKPRNEVLIDVMVMQVSSTYSRQFGMGLGTGINTSASFQPRPGITTPGVQSTTSSTSTTSTTTTTPTTTPATTTSSTGTSGTSSSIPFSELGHISSADYSITNLPGATFEAMLSDSTTRVLQSPQIRASDNIKASIAIGEKIPIATGSFSSGVGAVGALPAANTQFSFQDVGVKLEILPRVHDNNEVSMHIDLDVSQVLDRINVGGVSEPEIADNKVTADIRLREGEVNLIGGIIQETSSKSLTGVPGLAHIPLIGHFFNNEDTERSKTELVIALVPHIVRGPDISASNLKGVASGTSGQVKVSYDAAPMSAGGRPATMSPATSLAPSGTLPAAPPATAPLMAAPPATAPLMTAPPAARALPATGPLAIAPPATAPPMTAPPSAAPPAGRVPLGTGVSAPVPTTPKAPAAPGATARISIQPSTVASTLNSAITITIAAENVVDMADVTAQLQYDPKILRVTNIVAGELPGRNLAPLEVSKTVLDDVGRADMHMSRGSNGGTISGSGSLFSVVFQAIGRGNTSVKLNSVGMGNADGPVATSTPVPAAITVQ